MSLKRGGISRRCKANSRTLDSSTCKRCSHKHIELTRQAKWSKIGKLPGRRLKRSRGPGRSQRPLRCFPNRIHFPRTARADKIETITIRVFRSLSAKTIRSSLPSHNSNIEQPVGVMLKSTILWETVSMMVLPLKLWRVKNIIGPLGLLLPKTRPLSTCKANLDKTRRSRWVWWLLVTRVKLIIRRTCGHFSRRIKGSRISIILLRWTLTRRSFPMEVLL